MAKQPLTVQAPNVSGDGSSPVLEPKLEKIRPEDLLFDETNPRFGGELAGKAQEVIQKMLLDHPHYASELVDSLLANGFIQYEPLVVKRIGTQFVVIEGNRRLAAVKEIRANLSRYGQDDSFLEKIPVLIFPKESEDKPSSDMRVYLGVRHLFGFREWPSFSKAQFLDNESRNEGGLDTVLKEVRLTKQKAKRFLIPYRLLRAADISLGEEDFWMLAEALQRQGVKKFLQLDVDGKTLEINGYDKANLKQVLDDLYGPKATSGKPRVASKRIVSDTRYLSNYSNILMSTKATTVLHSGKSLDEASIYVDTQEQSLGKLGNASRSMGILLKKVIGSKTTDEAKNLLSSYKAFDLSVKEYVKRNG